MNRKGISMISLVVIIIVTLILVAIATTAGFRYINRVNEIKAQALGEVIGNAAYRRQNDVASGVTTRFYEGYLFDTGITPEQYAQIELLPEGDINNDGIPDCMQKEDEHGERDGHIWYVFDAESATSIGADKSEEFLTKNISYYFRTDLTDEEQNELVRVVLADYATGDGYYVKMPVYVLVAAVNNGSGACANSPTGTHKFTIPTCTEGSVCIYNCGTTLDNALGHDWVESTCTADGYCHRCGIPNPDDLASGHVMISNADISNADLITKLAKENAHMVAGSSSENNYAWVVDSNKHWHECIKCGERFDETTHDRAFVSIDDVSHQELCAVCGWESVVSKHKLKHESLTDNTHKVACEVCTYEATHNDTGWINGSTVAWPQGHANFHYRICAVNDDCNDLELDVNGRTTKIIFKEAHYDNNHDFLCDVCGKDMDTLGPVNFDDEDARSYAKVIDATTSTITIEAFTIDEESEVASYQFGEEKIGPDGKKVIVWSDDLVPVNNPTDKAHYTFTGKTKETTYTFYVRAFDRNGNSNVPYPVIGTTLGFPEFIDITGKPPEGTYVHGPIDIGVVPVETTDPGVKLMYKIDNGEWVGPFPPDGSNKTLKEAMEELSISISQEHVDLYFKFVDETGTNESQTWHREVEAIDITPPHITIAAKTGDTPGTPALSHQATITISDELSGIDKNTEVKYGWSTNPSVPPSTNLTTVTTTNTENVKAPKTTTIDVTTPAGVNGTYYLWVIHGTKDAAGNPYPEDIPYKNEQGIPIGFVVDDEVSDIINILMMDLTPAVDGEVKFVKTNGTVTVTFTSTKDLDENRNPIVRLNGVDMNVARSGRNYTCTLRIDDTFDEGYLELFIGDVVTSLGRVSDRTYSNADLSDHEPVYYDKTNPVLEYIRKRG